MGSEKENMKNIKKYTTAIIIVLITFIVIILTLSKVKNENTDTEKMITEQINKSNLQINEFMYEDNHIIRYKLFCNFMDEYGAYQRIDEIYDDVVTAYKAGISFMKEILKSDYSKGLIVSKEYQACSFKNFACI